MQPKKRLKNHSTSASTAKSEETNEYEKKRQQNIQKNLEIMRSMGIITAKAAAHKAIETWRIEKRKPAIKRSATESEPTRYSLRIRGEKPTDLGLHESNSRDEETSDGEQRQERYSSEMVAQGKHLDEKENRQFLKDLSKLSSDDATERKIESASQYELSSENIFRAFENRVYSMSFHPQTTKVLLVIGSAGGDLTLLAPSFDNEDKTTLETYRPHTLPISRLLFDKSSTCIVTSSFDGSIRRFDLSSASFSEMHALPDEEGISDMCFDQARNRYMLSSTEGNLYLLDVRAASDKSTSYKLHEKKINTIHQHPLHSDYFVTASLDRSVQLWDIRKFARARSGKNVQSVSFMPHTRSVNCAYFSPSGSHCVTLCQNDYIYLYSTTSKDQITMAEPKPELSIAHRNVTGRWLSKLHPSWDPKFSESGKERFIVGCMLQPRRLQIFQSSQKSPIQELYNEQFKSVHSINVFHPKLDLLAGGNSSGRISLWTPRTDS